MWWWDGDIIKNAKGNGEGAIVIPVAIDIKRAITNSVTITFLVAADIYSDDAVIISIIQSTHNG